MSGRVPRVLLTGVPGAGKTTLVSRLVSELQYREIMVGGFTTRELLEHGARAGFVVEALGGGSAVLAHVRFTKGPRVGRYRVDVPAFERVALPALAGAVRAGGVVVVDELGQMELFSEAFVSAFERLFGQDVPVVATVHAKSHPVTDPLKTRADVELLTVTRDAHEELFAQVMDHLLGGLGTAPRPGLPGGSGRES
jgi:nucleoside-triphosphatase